MAIKKINPGQRHGSTIEMAGGDFETAIELDTSTCDRLTIAGMATAALADLKIERAVQIIDGVPTGWAPVLEGGDLDVVSDLIIETSGLTASPIAQTAADSWWFLRLDVAGTDYLRISANHDDAATLTILVNAGGNLSPNNWNR